MKIKMPILLSLLALLWFSLPVSGQDPVIRGRVTNLLTNEPLAGASVLQKGTTNATTTDEDGRFSINVPAGTALIISYTGLTEKEVIAQAGVEMNITLESASSLDEVVVVGYGRQRRTNVTGAISTINSKELLQNPVADMSNSLQGRVPGVISKQASGEPGADAAAIYIRGNSTFAGSMQPLFVVDGIVRDQRDFSQLDPNEIESVSVLKDASSAAIFGVKGANGVVLVTTKRGKAGKISATYSFNYANQRVTRFNDNLGSYEYATLFNEALLNDGLDIAYTNEELEQFRSGSDPVLFPNTDWQRLVLGGTAPQMQHNLSFSGGTDRVRYFASLGYLDQDGLYSSLNFKRYNVRTNLDMQVTNSTRVSIDISGRLENRTAPTTGISGIFEHTTRNPPTIPAYYPGVGYAQVGSYVNTLRSIDPAAGYNRNEGNVLLTNFQIEQQIPFVPGLSIKGVLAYDKNMTFRKAWSDNVYVYTANPGTGEYDRSAYQNPSLQEEFYQTKATELQAHLNYDQTFGKHSVSALVLAIQKESPFNRLFAARSGYEFSVFDILDQGPATNAGGDITEVIQGSVDRTALRSVAGRINYAFDNKYLFQASLRRDESENFAPDVRTGYFPAFSVGWVMTNEDFMDGVSGVLDYLKIRGSWGKLGSDNIPTRFGYFARYNSVPFNYAFGGSIVPGLNPTASNPLVSWEKSTKTDIGLEARLWQGLFNIDLDFFMEKRTDILATRSAQIPASYGGPLPAENIGETENRGVEVMITHFKRINNDFSYTLSGNITYTQNKIIYAAQAENVPDLFKVAGRPIGSYFGYKAIGIIRDEKTLQDYNKTTQFPYSLGDIMYEDVNNDGAINEDDRQWLAGGPVPQLVYGLSGGLSFKGFELNFLFQGAGKTNMQLTNNAGFAFFNGGRVTAEWLDRWTPDNPGASYPRLSTNASATTNNYQIPQAPPYGMGGNSFWIYDASYLRLKSLELAYTFRPDILQKVGANQLRVYANGQNLLTFTNIKNVDPENTNASGWYYPVQVILNVGVNLQF